VATSINRRNFERFRLPVGYTPIAVRPLAHEKCRLEGHAYDISEGGVRFELDRPVPAGTPVAMRIAIPTPDPSARRAVFVFGNVVWLNDDPDEPGPVRMAAVFTRFPSAGDKERLLNHLATGRYARAA
jgi:hypothetical protein